MRYVVRISGAVNVNIRLVAVGAAAPYFYNGRRGRYANELEVLAKRARAKKLGLWKACPHTLLDPSRAVNTGQSGPSADASTTTPAPTRGTPLRLVPPPTGTFDPYYSGGFEPPYKPDCGLC